VDRWSLKLSSGDGTVFFAEMTPDEVRKLRETLHLSHAELASLMDVDRRTCERWEERGLEVNRRRIPPTAALLLQACTEIPQLLQWLREGKRLS